MAVCIHCGQENPEGFRFCGSCGSPLHAAPAAEERKVVTVLFADVQGSMDSDRLATLHIPVTQLNTAGGFGGECHLDANMVRSALGALPLEGEPWRVGVRGRISVAGKLEVALTHH